MDRVKKAQIACIYHNIIPFRAKRPGDEKAAKLAYDDEYVFLIFTILPISGRILAPLEIFCLL